MRAATLACWLLLVPLLAWGDCECACVDGRNQLICEDGSDEAGDCPAKICAIEPPVTSAEETEPYLPPVRRSCRDEIEWDPVFREYQRLRVCR